MSYPDPQIRGSGVPNAVFCKSALGYYLPDYIPEYIPAIGEDCTGRRGGGNGMVYCYGCDVPLGLPAKGSCLECYALGHFAQDCPTFGGSGTSYGGQRSVCYSAACDGMYSSNAESRGPPWTVCAVRGEQCDAPQDDM
jgi:hypothetical protein